MARKALDGCDDWDVSADLPEWNSHPSIIKETRLRPDIVIHSASIQQLIMVELTVPYENRMEENHIYKREKYLNLTKELENAGYKAVVMPVEGQLAMWYSAGISNPSRDEDVCSNPGAVEKKKKNRETCGTWVWPGPLRVSKVQDRNTCYRNRATSQGKPAASSSLLASPSTAVRNSFSTSGQDWKKLGNNDLLTNPRLLTWIFWHDSVDLSGVENPWYPTVRLLHL
ncbi:hypothetical protein RRG08_023438 [Elysia crispata]|uniref:Uncharacterized protein n=1 Tax=Elysia crispata TaxID=231223 RepID=A0AAE1DWV5_9GAST|nr:hypothetical protein RRG08_023438 [Elysia crispata]